MKDKRKVMLIAVLAVLACILVITKLTASGPANSAPAPIRKADNKKAKAGIPRAVIKVDLELLKRQRVDYAASRNIFNPVYKKPSLPKPSAKDKGAKGAGSTVTVTPLPPLPPPPPPKSQAEIDAENAREEMKKLKVLGFLKRKGRTDVFLSLGQENFVVAKGGNITKDYYLTEVAKDSLTVSDKKTGITVKLSTDFSKEASSKTVPAPGYGGGAGPGHGGYQPPGGPAGYPPNRPLGRPSGAYGGGNYIQPGIQPNIPGGLVQPARALRPVSDPLNNFSVR